MNEKFENGFLKENPKYRHLVKYIKEALGRDAIDWGDFTKVNLQIIKAHFQEKVSLNTAATYMAVLKAYLNKFSDEGLVPCKIKDTLKGKKTPSQHVFLTEDEIDRIEAYKPRTESEASVQHQFLIECYMGARASDVENITEDNIRNGRIVYVSKKTHVETSVPIHRNLMKHLLAPKRKVSTAYYDRTIKEICRQCGITEPTKLFFRGKEQTLPKCEFVSSHTARRSFATNLRLRGVSISEICALMNHNKNEQMTARYICIDTRYLTSHAMQFFQ